MHYIKNFSTYKSLKKAVEKVRAFLKVVLLRISTAYA
jgi:hypothetical protein